MNSNIVNTILAVPEMKGHANLPVLDNVYYTRSCLFQHSWAKFSSVQQLLSQAGDLQLLAGGLDQQDEDAHLYLQVFSLYGMLSIPWLVRRDGDDQDCWNAIGYNTSLDHKEPKTITSLQDSSMKMDYYMRVVK